MKIAAASGGGIMPVNLIRNWANWTGEPIPTLPHWPVDREKILHRIERLTFSSDAELRTNFFPRKSMWEAVQLLKMKQLWLGGDESDWLSHSDIIGQHLDLLAQAGIRGARLVIAPFEVTKDGQNFDWSPIDTALQMFEERDLIASLSVGPIKFPFVPDGPMARDLCN